MANWYVWNAAAGGGTGADWTNAYTTLAAAATAKAAGDVFFVAHDHIETQATAKTITFAGTQTIPNRVYCVNRAGSVPPVSADLRTTAQVSTTVASAISLAGSVSECYGIIFSAGSGSSAATLTVGATSNRTFRCVNCKFILNSTSTSSRLALGTAASLTVLENCTVQFGSTSQAIVPVGRVFCRNTTSTTFLVGPTYPANLFAQASSTGFVFAEGLDLGNFGSAKYLVLGTTATISSVIFKDCKLGSGVFIVSGTIAGPGAMEVALIRCSSGDVNYDAEKRNALGVQTTTANIARSGGASDGATGVGWELFGQTTAVCSPFESLPISFWNETVGSPVTVTIDGMVNSASMPLNTAIWIEVEYLGTSGVPLGNRVTSGVADRLTAGSNLAAGSGTWSGGLSPATQFKMSVTFTPQEKGPVTIYVMVGANSVYYIDPKPVVT